MCLHFLEKKEPRNVCRGMLFEFCKDSTLVILATNGYRVCRTTIISSLVGAAKEIPNRERESVLNKRFIYGDYFTKLFSKQNKVEGVIKLHEKMENGFIFEDNEGNVVDVEQHNGDQEDFNPSNYFDYRTYLLDKHIILRNRVPSKVGIRNMFNIFSFLEKVSAFGVFDPVYRPAEISIKQNVKTAGVPLFPSNLADQDMIMSVNFETNKYAKFYIDILAAPIRTNDNNEVYLDHVEDIQDVVEYERKKNEEDNKK